MLYTWECETGCEGGGLTRSQFSPLPHRPAPEGKGRNAASWSPSCRRSCPSSLPSQPGAALPNPSLFGGEDPPHSLDHQ